MAAEAWNMSIHEFFELPEWEQALMVEYLSSKGEMQSYEDKVNKPKMHQPKYNLPRKPRRRS